MASRSVVIVGGGIAGLSAGCYARMNGYDATVLEMHNVPGGLCADCDTANRPSRTLPGKSVIPSCARPSVSSSTFPASGNHRLRA